MSNLNSGQTPASGRKPTSERSSSPSTPPSSQARNPPLTWTGVVHLKRSSQPCISCTQVYLLSLLAAFVAMLGKQWLNRYRRHTGGSTIERCGDRQRKFVGLEKWLFIERLPVMLQIALVLLACCLSRYTWSINKSAARLVVGSTVLGFIFYVEVMIGVISSYECPFQTPVSITLRYLRHGKTTRRLLANASLVNIISLTQRNARRFLARLSPRSTASLVYHAWTDAHHGLVFTFHRAHNTIRRSSSWEFSPSHILSGVQHAATRLGH